MIEAVTFGYVPDKPDPRDYRFAALEPKLEAPAGGETFVIPCERPARFQGGVNGSCTGCSVARANEVLDPTLPDLSGRGIWYLARQADGTEKRNVGTQVRFALAQERRVGLVPAAHDGELDPHDQPLSLAALMFAADHKGGEYYRIDPEDLAAIDRAIRARTPIVCGGDWDEAARRVSGDQVLDKPSGMIVGGHAVCLRGVRRVGGELQALIDNSHGEWWGKGGVAWATAAWLRTRRDLWALTRAP